MDVSRQSRRSRTTRHLAILTELVTVIALLIAIGLTLVEVLDIHRRADAELRRELEKTVVAPPAAPPPSVLLAQVPETPQLAPAELPAPLPSPSSSPTLVPTPRPTSTQTETPKPEVIDLNATRVAQLETLRLLASPATSLLTQSQGWLKTLQERAAQGRLANTAQQVSTEQRVKDSLTGAEGMNREADLLAREVGLLQRRKLVERSRLDEAKVLAANARSILSFQGQNGTWHDPIPVECKAGEAILQPYGLRFSLIELSDRFGIRGNPFVRAVLNEAGRKERGTDPIGKPRVPFVLFLVRPDGIRAYYEARARMEGIGVAFGYELIDNDLVMQYGEPGATSGSIEAGELEDDLHVWRAPPMTRGSRENTIEGLAPRPRGGLASLEADPPTGLNGTDTRAGRPDEGGVGEGLEPREVTVDANGGLGARPPLMSGDPGSGEGRASTGPVPTRRRDPDEPEPLPLLKPGRGPSDAGSDQPPMSQPRPLSLEDESRSVSRIERGSQITGPTSGGNQGIGPSRPSTETSISGNALGSTDRKSLTENNREVEGGSDGGGMGGGTGSGEFSPLVMTRPRSLEFVLVCGPSGLTIHPGGLRLSRTLLSASGGDSWMENLWDRVRMMEREEPGISILPSVRFLVAPGGHDLYWSLRSHMMSEGLNWPVRIQVIESESAPGLSNRAGSGS